MAHYQRITAINEDSVYVLDVYNSTSEVSVFDRHTGEVTDHFDTVGWGNPQAGQPWEITAQGGSIVKTAPLHGVRVDQYSPRTDTWCHAEELDRYSKSSIWS
jgi:hypothetical protein